MKLRSKRLLLSSFLPIITLSCCTLELKKGAEPVILSAELTDQNENDCSHARFFTGEIPRVLLNVSDEDQNIAAITAEVYCGEKRQYVQLNTVSQWKDPENYTLNLERLSCKPGDWKAVITVADQRGLSTETCFDFKVVDMLQELVIDEINTAKEQVNGKKKIQVKYTINDVNDPRIDRIVFDLSLFCTDGAEYKTRISQSSLQQESHLFYIEPDQEPNRASIDHDTVVVDVD